MVDNNNSQNSKEQEIIKIEPETLSGQFNTSDFEDPVVIFFNSIVKLTGKLICIYRDQKVNVDNKPLIQKERLGGHLYGFTTSLVKGVTNHLNIRFNILGPKIDKARIENKRKGSYPTVPRAKWPTFLKL